MNTASSRRPIPDWTTLQDLVNIVNALQEQIEKQQEAISALEQQVYYIAQEVEYNDCK